MGGIAVRTGAEPVRGFAKVPRAVEEEADVVHVHGAATPRCLVRGSHGDAELMRADLLQELVNHEGEQEGGEHAPFGDTRVAVDGGGVVAASEAEPDAVGVEERLQDAEQRAGDALAPQKLPEQRPRRQREGAGDVGLADKKIIVDKKSTKKNSAFTPFFSLCCFIQGGSRRTPLSGPRG